jgi:hypothetical protein
VAEKRSHFRLVFRLTSVAVGVFSTCFWVTSCEVNGDRVVAFFAYQAMQIAAIVSEKSAVRIEIWILIFCPRTSAITESLTCLPAR